jgi:glycosyltransferase involved in cell wall biosynthesis
MILPWLTMGGADKFNLDLVEQLTNRGYEITICTTRESDNSWLPHFAKLTPEIFTRDDWPDLSDYPHLLGNLIESGEIDLVLTSNSTLGYQLLPYLRSRCVGVTFVDYNHIREEYWRDGGHPRSAVAYQELLDLNIVSNRDLKEWMVQRGADASRIELCYTNIDPARWDPARYSRSKIRRSLAVPQDVPLILYAGRLCEQKRPRLFARILLQLVRQKLDLRCLVAGAGPEQRFLEAFMLRHRLGGRVRLLGGVSNRRMRELMAAADIFLLPSQWEGIAVTLYEAMAMEVVPVSADVGGQRELVTPDCGFLVSQDENELQEYASTLRQLLESPELRAKMGGAGRRRIREHFRSNQMGERMIALLDHAQSLSKASPRHAVGGELGLESAALAIEYARADRLAEELGSLAPIKRSRVSRLARRAADTLPGWVIYELVRAVASKLQRRRS